MYGVGRTVPKRTTTTKSIPNYIILNFKLHQIAEMTRKLNSVQSFDKKYAANYTGNRATHFSQLFISLFIEKNERKQSEQKKLS